MGKKIAIIGGGIIGLCSAYYLFKEGHEVTVIDKSNLTKGASNINAGFITPSHFIPLSNPQLMSKGLIWMFQSSSPFYVKPTINLDFLNWSWQFIRSAKASKVEKAIPIIKDINLLGRELYEELKTSNDFDFHYERKGLMMYYQTEKAGEEEWEIGKLGIKEGLTVKNLTKREIKIYEPDVDLNVLGAVYYDSDAHMTPNSFIRDMILYLKENGVSFLIEESVENIEFSKGIIKAIKTNNRLVKVDEVVIAAGAWSSAIMKKLGAKLPIQAGKGYSINVQRKTNIKVPSILTEAKVAVTPMDGFTRFAGTMELGRINHNINETRVKTIAKASESYYNGIKFDSKDLAEASCGLRPCSPDGIPYIGRPKRYRNLTIASGHAMMGWSLGPATGKLVSEIISDKKTSLSLLPFSPDRFN